MHVPLPMQVKAVAKKVVHSIDYSGPKLMAIRTLQGQPEERQELKPGSKGFGVCKWDGEDTEFQTDVPNLMLQSRPARPTVKKRPAKAKKGGAKKKAKGAAKKKAKAEEEVPGPKAGEEAPGGEEDEDSEEEDAEEDEEDTEDAEEMSQEARSEQEHGKGKEPAEKEQSEGKSKKQDAPIYAGEL